MFEDKGDGMKKLRVIIDDNLKIDEEKGAVETIKVEIEKNKVENFNLKFNEIRKEKELNLFSIYENEKGEKIFLPFEFFVENIKNLGKENWKIIKWLFRMSEKKWTSVLCSLDVANKMGLKPEIAINFLNKLNLWKNGQHFKGYDDLPLKVYVNDDEGAVFLKGDEFNYENWVYNLAYVKIVNDYGEVRFIVNEREF